MKFVIFDLEATCWEGNSMGREQEIIEIGALITDHYGSVQSSFRRFVRPEINPSLSHYCQQLTGITQEDVRRARLFETAGREFIDWIEANTTDYVLCSWGDKDREFLYADCDRHDMETDWLESYIDLKAQYHELKGFKRKRGLKKVLEKEGFEFEGSHHRALDDAENLLSIFSKYRDMWMY